MELPLQTVQRHFIEVEKNVIALGFFTPSSSRLMTEAAKTNSVVRYVDGKRLETVASILPSAYYGLPVTADQDKYFAFLKIIQEIRRRTGVVPNPVGFTSAELLRVLGSKKNGKNYSEVADWMKRMTATTISAAVYFAGKKMWVEDTFHVFERAVLKGMEISPGNTADMNFVWLSTWQYENITANFQLPIDFDAYKAIRNHIAKALVPLLQIWLYSSLGSGRFEKSYTDLCRLLAIRRYTHLSKIREVLGPSLNELMSVGYISSWTIEARTSRDDFKLTVTHGPKFFEDREVRMLRGTESGVRRSAGPAQLERELVSRGVEESVARQLLSRVPDSQPVVDQLEWGDYLIQTGPSGKFRNPAGFYVYLVRNAILPPAGFETSSQRQQRRQYTAARSAADSRRLEDENEYAHYRYGQVSRALEAKYPGGELAAAVARAKAEIRGETPECENWLPVRLEELAMQRLRAQAAADLQLLTFEEFLERRQRQMRLFGDT